MDRLLLVEDSEESKDLVFIALDSSFSICWAEDLTTATQKLDENQFDLILLDVELPDGDGFRFFSLVLNHHQHKNTPVMFLTAKDNPNDKVLGFSLGADDYILKPFHPGELKARIEMRLKKLQGQKQNLQILNKNELEIHLDAQRVFLKVEDKRIELPITPFEFKLLSLLTLNEERVFSRSQLLDKLWGTDVHLTDRCIDTHIYTLRKKMGELGRYIQAIYGEGYRFSRSVEQKRTRSTKRS